MTEIHVAGVLIAYETDPVVLLAATRRLGEQLDSLYVVDNSADPQILKAAVADAGDSAVQHVSMGGNAGIARAQNLGIDRATRSGADFILFLDDDSTFPAGGVATLVAEFLKFEKIYPGLAGIGPRVVDERSGRAIAAVWEGSRIVPSSEVGLLEVAYLVSSGALVSAAAFGKFGALRGEYFIDHVDKEWGLRVGKAGGTFLVTPEVTLVHRLGDEPVTTKRGATRYRHGSAVRDYYLTRNAILMMRDLRLGWRKTAGMLDVFLRTAIRKLGDRSLTRSQRRAVRQGILDGLLNRRGPRRDL
ncbi:MAG: glfT1 [Microbacterium sp.]|jgi:rhamnosyltransferase|nr:glfT1 [Microbacterium sp.]